MNERIEKMMLEATKDIPQGYYVPPQYFEKFAELIVGECTKILADNSEFRSCVIIGKHFRVEE